MQRSARRPLPARHLALLPLAAWLALAAAGPAGAQVTRCTDPATGKVTYTDGSCARGAAAQEVEPRRTPEQIQQDREQAAEALERKRERQQLDAQQDRLEAERAARERAATAAAPSSTADPARSAECQRARRELQEVNASLGRGMYDEQARLDAAQRQADLACLSPAAYAEAERARASRAVPPSPYYAPPVVIVPPRPAPPRPAPTISHCNVFRCYDTQGNTYPR